jgi:hypothetical protein
VKVIQRMLGHASAAMTLDVYADLFDDDLTGVAERLTRLWAKCGQTGRSETPAAAKKCGLAGQTA